MPWCWTESGLLGLAGSECPCLPQPHPVERAQEEAALPECPTPRGSGEVEAAGTAWALEVQGGSLGTEAGDQPGGLAWGCLAPSHHSHRPNSTPKLSSTLTSFSGSCQLPAPQPAHHHRSPQRRGRERPASGEGPSLCSLCLSQAVCPAPCPGPPSSFPAAGAELGCERLLLSILLLTSCSGWPGPGASPRQWECRGTGSHIP